MLETVRTVLNRGCLRDECTHKDSRWCCKHLQPARQKGEDTCRSSRAARRTASAYQDPAHKNKSAQKLEGQYTHSRTHSHVRVATKTCTSSRFLRAEDKWDPASNSSNGHLGRNSHVGDARHLKTSRNMPGPATAFEFKHFLDLDMWSSWAPGLSRHYRRGQRFNASLWSDCQILSLPNDTRLSGLLYAC